MKNIYKKKAFIKSLVNDGFDCSGYQDQSINDYQGQIEFIYKTFMTEYGHWNIKQAGTIENSLTEWLSGLPSVLYVPFYYSDILSHATEKMGYTFKSEYEEDAFINTWFARIAVALSGEFRAFKLV